MNEFKVDDLIIASDTISYRKLTKNKVYKVLAIKIGEDGEPLVTILNDDHKIVSCYEYRFELADKPLPDWF